jgi:uncharacterized protein DUF5995
VFPYDPALLAIVQAPPTTIDGVLDRMRRIDATCADADGLKWFNWLYLQVTETVASRVATGTFNDAAWLSELDVQFARLYFNALGSSLGGATCPGCWKAFFDVRSEVAVARIQFALAGVNAHINHDLPAAIVSTSLATHTVPSHGSPQFRDYTSLNPTLDALIQTAKVALHVRLLGDPLPPISHVENTIAAWGLAAAREKAWTSSEVLWHLHGSAALTAGYLDTLDGLTTVAGKALLVPAIVPR